MVALNYLLTQHSAQFGMCLGSMGAKRVQERNVLLSHPRCFQFSQQYWYDPIIGCSTGDVAMYNDHLIAMLNLLSKRRGINWVAHGHMQSSHFIGHTRHKMRSQEIGF